MYYRRLLQYGRQIYFLYFLYKQMVAVKVFFKENQIGKVPIQYLFCIFCSFWFSNTDHVSWDTLYINNSSKLSTTFIMAILVNYSCRMNYSINLKSCE